MKIKFKVKDDFLLKRIKKLKSYTCKQEKEILLNDDLNIQEIYKILSPNGPKPINDLECMVFIIKLIEISVSDIFSKMYECSCGMINELNYSTEDLLNLEQDSEIPLGIFESLDDIIKEKEINKIKLKDYNKLQEKIENQNKKIINLTIKNKCRTCKKENNIIINPIDLISRTNIAGLYDEYFSLMFYSGMSKKDIDDMYPFERELFLNLLKKKVESQD